MTAAAAHSPKVGSKVTERVREKAAATEWISSEWISSERRPKITEMVALLKSIWTSIITLLHAMLWKLSLKEIILESGEKLIKYIMCSSSGEVITSVYEKSVIAVRSVELAKL